MQELLYNVQGTILGFIFNWIHKMLPHVFLSVCLRCASLVLEQFMLKTDSYASVQKKSRLHGCEPEEGLLNLCQF